MKYALFLVALFPSILLAQPRNPHPNSPDQVIANDRDLLDDITNAKNTINENFGFYTRPSLIFSSVTTIDVSTNTSTSNTTRILFHDGEMRTVTENVLTTDKYRRCIITSTANWTSGTEDSGMDTTGSVTESTNTWYTVLAIKSKIDTSKFVVVLSTVEMIPSQYVHFDNRYDVKGWIHLGMWRNGDTAGAIGDGLAFTHNGNLTKFTNTTTTGGNLFENTGIRLATTAGATSLTYTYASGMKGTQIPSNLTVVTFVAGCNAGSGTSVIRSTSGSRIFSAVAGGSILIDDAIGSSSEGCQVVNGSSVAMDIYLVSFFDSALGVGSNP